MKQSYTFWKNYLSFTALFAFLVLATSGVYAQTAPAAPSVKIINEKELAELIKPKEKPLLINFWATWCGPCREEFPDLVKIDGEYKGKIDFITITLDFEEELTTGVPKFLTDMKAQMPTFLLLTADESAAISMVSKDWGGALPFTILIAPDGKVAYSHQGIVKHDVLKGHLDKLLPAAK